MVSKAQIAATARYEKKAYDKTLIRLPAGELEKIREAANKEEKSINNFIRTAIQYYIDHNKTEE